MGWFIDWWARMWGPNCGCGYDYVWPHDYAFPEETCDVQTVVVATIPEFGQVKVRDEQGHLYALTPSVIDILSLKEGDRVLCTVTRHLPRVLKATLQPE